MVMQGLQVFDNYGNTVFDSKSKIARVCGIITGGTVSNPVSGSVYIDSRFFDNNDIFYLLTETAVGDTNLASALSKTDISTNGRRLDYKNLPVDLIYGVY